MPGFVDANAATWLDGLVEAAVEEARERGQQLVAPQHLGLALTRDAQTAQLLDELGIRPRRWRDYINFVLGVNEGMDAVRHERVRSGHLVAARELYFDGEAVLGGAVRAIVSHARSDADGRAVGPAGLLTAILTGGAGGIAAGTARWVGLTAAAVREAAGLPTAARPLLEGTDPTRLPRPDPCGPLVLLGGGPIPPEALRAAVELTGIEGRPQVAWVSAAHPWAPEMAEVRQRQFDKTAPDTRVTDIGLDSRTNAEHPRVTAALEQADVVFLEGGKCELLYRALAGTAALEALVAFSERGGVVVGYSAGAQVLGAGFLTNWMSWGERDEPHRLLGWLADTVIHPHASGHREVALLRATVAAFSARRGLGVAHGGAVQVPTGSPVPLGINPGWEEGCVTIAGGDAEPVPIGRGDGAASGAGRGHGRRHPAELDLRAEWHANASVWVAWARAPVHDSYWRHHRDQFLGLVPAAGHPDPRHRVRRGSSLPGSAGPGPPRSGDRRVGDDDGRRPDPRSLAPGGRR